MRRAITSADAKLTLPLAGHSLRRRQRRTGHRLVAGMSFRFAPGQMRARALPRRSAASVGGVQVKMDLTRKTDPISVDLSAALVDVDGGLIAGCAVVTIVDLKPA
jgi:hypothetical protein